MNYDSEGSYRLLQCESTDIDVQESFKEKKTVENSAGNYKFSLQENQIETQINITEEASERVENRNFLV